MPDDIILNPFMTDAYELSSLTEAINRIPNSYGLLNQLGIFKDKGVYTRHITVDEKNGVLRMLRTLPPGSPGQYNDMGTRAARGFTIPHIPIEDSIIPEEYQGIRGFGKTQEAALADIMLDHLETGRLKMEVTREYMRMGALKGQIYDGNSVLVYDLFKEFVIKQNSVDFDLDTSTTNIRDKCLDTKRLIRKYLKGEVATGALGIVHPTFMSALAKHATVQTAYERWRDGEFLRTGDIITDGFDFGGIKWIEYEAEVPNASGTLTQFITDNEGIVIPLGTRNTFVEYFAPADFLETVGTKGLPFYSKREARKYNRGIDIHMQTNPLPLCLRPELLIRVYF